MSIDNSQKNIVNLLYKDHIIAHCYIVLSSCESFFKVQNMCAIYKLTGHRDFKGLKEDMLHLDEVQKAYESSKELLYANNPMFNSMYKEAHDKVCKTDAFKKNVSDGMKKYRSTHPFSEEHCRRLSEAAKKRIYIRNSEERSMINSDADKTYVIVNYDFDTRSIACYCIDSRGCKHVFHSYKEAGIWWYNTYNPFNTEYAECTMQRKIKQSIKFGKCTYKLGKKDIVVDNVKWYRCEKSCAETIESI